MEEKQKGRANMVDAVGVDIVDIDRFAIAFHRWGRHFTQRILTDKEMEYCEAKANGIHSMAVRFAAKEALLKCLPSEEQHGFRWGEMEILNAQNGKPVVHLHGRLERLLRHKEIHISLSHTQTSAIAVVMVQQKC